MSDSKLSTLMDRPALKVYSRVIHRTLESQHKNADRLFREAGLSADDLWTADEGDNWWTYSDWFQAIRLGYRECGPMFPVLHSRGMNLSAIPLMEEIVASSPNFATTVDMWESWQQELEPLFSLTQKKRAGRHFFAIDYMVRGKILEAFSLCCAALVCQMAWSHFGRPSDFTITVNFPDTYGTFEAWSKMWRTPLQYSSTQNESLVFEFSENDMKARNVGYHPLRFAAARERYFEILKTVVEFATTPSLIDFAAAVMKTSRKQFTRQSIADEIGVTEKQYSNALAEKGLTHKAFVDSVQMSRVKEMQELGYPDSKVRSALGINDPRKLQRLIERVSQ